MKHFTFNYAYVDYDLYSKDDVLYFYGFDLKNLFGIDDEKLKKIIDDYKIQLNLKEDKFSIEIEYLKYYDLNILISYALERNPELINSIYKAIKKEDEEKKIENSLLLKMKKINSISKLKLPWDEFKDILYTMKQEENIEENIRYCKFFLPIYFIDVLNVIDDLKKRYSLDKHFGEFEDFDKADSLFEECFKKEEENEETKSYQFYATKLFYKICKNKPFKENNEELAVISTLLFMYKNKLLYRDYILEYNSSNFFRMIIAYEKVKDLDEEEAIQKMIPIISISTFKILKKSDLSFEKFENEPTKENAIRFIIDFLEERSYRQGYYEYFSTKSSDCLKIHYHGWYYDFKLNYSKTMNSKDTLFFDCLGYAYSEAPNMINNRNAFLCDRFEEIKRRNKVDILKQIQEDLKNKFKGTFDLKSINIEITPTWYLKGDLDYEF